MSGFQVLLGTQNSYFQLGFAGPRLTANSAIVEARTSDGSALTPLSASLITANSLAAGNVPLKVIGANGGQSGNLLLLQAYDGTAIASLNNNGFLRIGATTPFSNAPIFVSGTLLSANSYVQAVIQNPNSGANASSEFVATADTGTDTTNYLALGINSSTFTNSGDISGALDSFVMTNGGHLVLAAGTAAKSIKFGTGGIAPANLRMTLSDAALTMNGIALVTPKYVSFTEYANGTKSANWTLDFGNGQKQSVTMGSSNSITSLSFPGAGNYVLRVTQDATGGRTLTWPGTIKAPGGKAAGLVLSTAANAVDVVSIYYDGTTGWATIAKAFAS